MRGRGVGKLWKTIRFTRRPERIIPMSRYGSGGIAENGTLEIGKRERSWSTDRTLCVLGSAGSNEHGELGRPEGGPEEDSLEKS